MRHNRDFIWVFSGANLNNKVIFRIELCLLASVPHANIWHATPWKHQSNAKSNSCDWLPCLLFIYSYRFLFKFLRVVTVLCSTQNGFPTRTLVLTGRIMTYKSQTGLSKQWLSRPYLQAPQPFFPLFVIIWQVMCYTCHYLIWLHTGLQISCTISFQSSLLGDYPGYELNIQGENNWKGDDMLSLPVKSCIQLFHFLLFCTGKQCCTMELIVSRMWSS